MFYFCSLRRTDAHVNRRNPPSLRVLERQYLKYADRDAIDLAARLLTQEGHIYSKVTLRHLINADATRQGFIQAFHEFYETMRANEGDVAVVFFSGHGTMDGEEFYLMPHDAQIEPSFMTESTCIGMNWLKKLLGNLSDKGKLLMLLDACHSGGVMAGAKGSKPLDIGAIREELAAAGNGVIVFTSSRANELSREHDDWQNGAFTEALLEALDGKADLDSDLTVSVTDLESYVQSRVRELTKKRQNPRAFVIGEHHFNARLFVCGL